MRFIKNYFRILRAMLILHLLRKYTAPDYIPLVTYGRFLAHKGDIAVINNLDGDFELGEVMEVNNGDAPLVCIQLFRRPG